MSFTAPTLSRDFVGPPTLDFEGLVQRAITLAQSYAGEHWTDYNEHDPGVTILQQFCFSLTDLAYRTEHPIVDIALGGAQDIARAVESQALHRGDEAFVCAALTEEDYRRLLYDSVTGLQNAWVVPEPDGPAGAYRVLIQRYAVAREGTEMESSAVVCARAEEVLHNHRNLGDDFSRVVEVQEIHLSLAGELHASSVETAEDIVAEVLHAVQSALVPPPGIVSVGRLMEDGQTPDAVFTGPHLAHGSIALEPTNWWTTLPAPAQIHAAAQRVRGVTGVHALSLHVEVTAANGGSTQSMHLRAAGSRWAPTTESAVASAPLTVPSEPWIPVIQLPSESSTARLRVIRDGHPHELRRDLVTSGLSHIRARLRQTEEHSVVATRHLDYLRLPEARNRRLGHYRSLQHFFPVAYGLGPDGAPEDHWAVQMADGTYQRRPNADAPEILQLKGYLLFIEQLLCDHLAQLDHIGALLSGDRPGESHVQTEVEPTLLTQSLAHEPADVDDPPHASLVLRSTRSTPTRTERRRDLARREQILDHLLARFGEAFPPPRDARDTESTNDDDEQRTRDRLTRKRTFLRRIVALGRYRGRGIDYRSARPHNDTHLRTSALADRLALLSGIESIQVVEHILLRPRQRRPGPIAESRSTEQLAEALRELDIAEAQLEAARQHVAHLQEQAQSAEWAKGLRSVLQQESIAQEFEIAAKKLADARATLLQPQKVSAPHAIDPLCLSVVCCGADPRAVQQLELLVAQECPAHLDAEVLVVSSAAYDAFAQLLTTWLAAWQPSSLSGATETLVPPDKLDIASIDARAYALLEWLAAHRQSSPTDGTQTGALAS